MKRSNRALLLAAMIVAGTDRAIGAVEDTEAWVGTWFSESHGDVATVTTLMADGSFRTEYLFGIRVVQVLDGKWELRDDAFQWSYEDSGRPVEDVNAIVLKKSDRFTLREQDGSESSFFRKGIVDPMSPPELPVAVGAGWVMKDELGEFTIRVTLRQTIGGHDCYRVDWIQSASEYQSEFWFMDSEGIHVAGRRVFGTMIEFQKPYLLVKRGLTPGDEWDASLIAEGKEVKGTISVGQGSEIETASGTFHAVPVTLESDEVHYIRWYAKDVGLVREDVLVGGDVHNTKTLQRRLE